jgi:hypothetical protein
LIKKGSIKPGKNTPLVLKKMEKTQIHQYGPGAFFLNFMLLAKRKH